MQQNIKKTVLSGAQTTGNLHLGNYLGAINNWLFMQHDYECFFFLADLHAITVPQRPEDLHASIIKTAASFIASGIDSDKSTIFAQSMVPEHTELAWIFNCVTPLGWLRRMTQFKDKAGDDQEIAPLGLFSYPVLMAADILLYQAHYVPVGEDQKQHLELTRDIAGVINRKFKKEVFRLPEALITGEATRVMSLKDGTKKMSKSDESDLSRINLSDSAEAIAQKIKKAKTDSIAEIYSHPDRPEMNNLVNIFASVSDQDKNSIYEQYKNSGTGRFKNDLAEVIIAKLAPITSEYNRLLQNQDYLLKILEHGAEKAKVRAAKTLKEVKELMGFLNDA